MSACAMLTYNNVTAPIFDCICAKAAALGIHISGDSGSYSGHGLTVTWNYTRAKSVLQIQCTSHPIFFPCSTINGKIDDAISGCLVTHDAKVEAMLNI